MRKSSSMRAIRPARKPPRSPSDVRTYFPTADAWLKLRTYGTRQWLTIDDAFVPASWNEALDQAAEGQLLPGTIAYTVTGTRHRAGIVGTERAGDISTDRVHSLHRVRAQLRRVPAASTVRG